MLLAVRSQVHAQTSTPTPVIPIYTGPMFEGLEDSNEIFDDLDADITAPGGVPLLPDPNYEQLFSFVKWLLSPSAADELVGPFAPLIVHMGVFVSLLIITGGIYALIYMAVYVLRIVAWLIRWILEILSALAEIGSVAANVIGTIVDVIWPF